MKTLKFTILVFVCILIKNGYSQKNNDLKIQSLFSDNKVRSIQFKIPHKSYPANVILKTNIVIHTIKNKVITLEGRECVKHFNITAIGATIDTLGNIKISNKKSLIRNSIIVNATSKYNHLFNTVDTIEINFKDTLKLSYNGDDGIPGENGKHGESGKRLGNKASGAQNGLNGMRGKDGLPGHKINIKITLIFDSIFKKNLLNIYIDDNTTLLIDNFLMDPDSGFAIINARGGSGGKGGRGGDGGNGVDGICRKRYNGYGTRGAKEGKGGRGGNGGRGGEMIIVFDSLCVNYIHHIEFLNEGGTKGKGGCYGNPGGDGQSYYNGVPSNYYFEKNYQIDTGLNGEDGCKGPEPIIKIL